MAGLGYWNIQIEKQGYWRGAQHTWTNHYVMSGSNPSASDATSVINALKAIENQLHATVNNGLGVGFVEGRAYLSTGGYPFAVVPYNTSLAPATATGFAGAGYTGKTQASAYTLETCALIETPLQGLSARGKPIYLRKYIRGTVFGNPEDTGSAAIPAADLNGIKAIVAPWTTGLGSNGWVVIGTSGKQSSGPAVLHPYLVNHQVPRGRKRKTSSKSGGLLGQLEQAVQTVGGATSIGEAVGAAL